MIARRTTLVLLAAAMSAASSACARDTATPPPVPRELDLGVHRVQVTVPTGWVLLDQGKQKRFRQGELEIVLQNLGPATPAPRDLDALIEWGLAGAGHDQRSEVKSRRTLTIDGRQAISVETWYRLDHTNPQRLLLVSDDSDLLALYTVRWANDETLEAFDAIRDSLHFVATTRR